MIETLKRAGLGLLLVVGSGIILAAIIRIIAEAV